MTKKELEQLRALNIELDIYTAKLKELRAAQCGTACVISGLPHIHQVKDHTGLYIATIDALERMIQERVMQSIDAYAKINAWISDIDNAFLRCIFTLYYVDCLSWQQVAMRIGGDNTGDSVRMIAKRFLEKSKLDD